MGVKKDSLPITWLEGDRAPHISVLLSNNPVITRAIDALDIDLLEKGERRLELDIKAGAGGWPRQLGLLKIAFWEEYRLAHKERRRMRIEDVFFGICHRAYWDKQVVQKPLHLAWMIHPPADELILQKEIIQLTQKKIRDALDMPIYNILVRRRFDQSTKEWSEENYRSVNVPLLKQVLEVMKAMQDRVHGSVVKREQREVKSLNLHQHQGVPTTPVPAAPRGIDAPDITLEELQAFQATIASTLQTLGQINTRVQTGELASDVDGLARHVVDGVLVDEN